MSSLSSAPLLPGLPRFSADAEELAASPVVLHGAVREPPKGRLSRVVSLDMWLAEMDGDDAGSEMASVREEEAEELQQADALKEEQEEDQEEAPQEEDAADGGWLFSQLQRISDVSAHGRDDTES